MKYLTVCSLLLFSMGTADSLRLINDSPFVLDCIVMAATGDVMVDRRILQMEHYQWNFQPQPNRGNTPALTPYTVIWRCEDGRDYGTSTYVGQNEWVPASTAEGKKICRIDRSAPTYKPNPADQSEEGD
ncbi:MAG: hypothetical protein MRY21_00910 [Simkaniaceae bacterium]|nr:hypothetical protein [Simkaniaceae bacterium]